MFYYNKKFWFIIFISGSNWILNSNWMVYLCVLIVGKCSPNNAVTIRVNKMCEKEVHKEGGVAEMKCLWFSAVFPSIRRSRKMVYFRPVSSHPIKRAKSKPYHSCNVLNFLYRWKAGSYAASKQEFKCKQYRNSFF